jgi:F0F1-type ATP synthase membrane subunit c/vacuolar-type H+-ATPase subunit K
MLYSVDSMTTRGASGLMLQRHWQMMGALEAADGMLLFGIGTAYMFAAGVEADAHDPPSLKPRA